MLDALNAMPLSAKIAITFMMAMGLLVALARSQQRPRGAYRPQGPDRDFDECFPEQAVYLRHGIVAERKEVMLPQYTLSAVQRPQPTMVPHYAYTIICHDSATNETLEITTEKNDVNVFVDAGRHVEVRSQRSRLDHSHMVHSVSAV